MRSWITLVESLDLNGALDFLCDQIAGEIGAVVTADVSQGSIHIDHLRAHEKGSGAEALRRVLSFADAHHLPTTLAALDGQPGLIRYYLRFGFTVNGVPPEAQEAWFKAYEAEWAERMEDDDFDPSSQVSIGMTRPAA